MKIADGFVIREIMGQAVAVPTGQASESFSGMIKLNETGKEVWNGVAEGLSEEEIVERIVEKYEVSAEDAKQGVSKFLKQMVERGFIQQ